MNSDISTQKNKPHSQHENDLPAELAIPARLALVQAGYLRLEQLAEISEAEIMKLHSIGPNALAQHRRALGVIGLSFAVGKL